MDADQNASAYQQYTNEQLRQIGRLASPLGVIILLYFIFSDLYFRESAAVAVTRLLPLSCFLCFAIGAFTRLGNKRPTGLTICYHLALFALVSMSYLIAIIAWDRDAQQLSVTGLMVVSIMVFLMMRGPIINLVVIYLLPSSLFVFYVIRFLDPPTALADFANGYVVILGAIVLYAYDEKLRRSKFFAENELLRTNQKMSLLTTRLQEQNVALQNALKEVHQLSGLLPICANCKRIRDEDDQWRDVAVYIRDHSAAEFSHSICPDCARELYPAYYRAGRAKVSD